jgi:hypothetical protein
MRVIVINPWDQSITEAEHNGDYRDYYRLLSGPTAEGYDDASVNCFDITPIGDPNGHIMFVDDEGLLSNTQAYFTMGKQSAVFGGRGVIACGSGGEDEVGATISIDDVRASITWLPIGTEVDLGHPVIEGFETVEAMVNRLEERSREFEPLIPPKD